jgi:hypothetical protein
MKNRNSKMKKLIIVSVVIIFCLILVPKQSFAGSDDIRVKAVYRISHPAYTMSNLWETMRSPWNVDYSRIMMFENDYAGHPDFSGARTVGRGDIWGCISSSCVSDTPAELTLQDLDLDNASVSDKKLAEWDDNTFDFPQAWIPDISSTDQLYRWRIYWSPYAGETNIVYALNRVSKKLVTYNVDTGAETEIISYDPSDTSVLNAEIMGFTKDATTGSLGHSNEIIIKFCYTASCGLNSGPTYRIFTGRKANGVFVNPTRTRENIPSFCGANDAWYPHPASIHSDSSPDGLYYATYARIEKNDFKGSGCSAYPSYAGLTDHFWEDTDMYAHEIGMGLTHLSWMADNDWYVEGGGNTRLFQTVQTYPEIITEYIYQVIFNRALADTKVNDACPECFTHNQLIARSSASSWNNKGYSANYHSLPSPTISFDGKHLHFQGTNGKYTLYDKENCASAIPNICTSIGNNWEGIGTYIADLSQKVDSIPPSPPTGITVQ